jgi:hypothetical protein
MPTASARGNITLETPVLASLIGPDDVVPAPTGNDAHPVTADSGRTLGATLKIQCGQPNPGS